jgi:carbonic anhydrase
MLLTLALGGTALGADQHDPAPPKKISEALVTPKEVGDHVREALSAGDAKKKNLTLLVNGKEKNLITMPITQAPAAAASGAATAKPAAESAREPAAPEPVADSHAAPPVAAKPRVGSQHARAKAATAGAAHGAQKGALAAASHGGEVHWDYEGENGPQAWGKLKPDFSLCATGKRQSPINIEDNFTLQGPAEALQFSYQPSSASVVNNGHTIQVDVFGDNSITVRGSNYKLLQFHFHHPSEERVNYKPFAMVAHLVHKNAEGQLAVVGVLLEPGTANPLINKVWTYMPLDSGDRVRMPDGVLNLSELLPTDQRYYQFMGSLTTPPCSEGVLWMVLKQPVQISKEQLKLFGQLFPNNARPVQPLNGRAVRSAQ